MFGLSDLAALIRSLVDWIVRRSERQLGRVEQNLEALRAAEADEERAREVRRQVKHLPVEEDDGYRRD